MEKNSKSVKWTPSESLIENAGAILLLFVLGILSYQLGTFIYELI
jgi:hypothetical protein